MLDSDDVNKIPTESFDEDPITKFCFGENAEKYGLFLKEAGIKAMPLWFDSEDYIKGKEKPYVNQLWLSGLDLGSGLDGDSWGLSCDDRSRGVK